ATAVVSSATDSDSNSGGEGEGDGHGGGRHCTEAPQSPRIETADSGPKDVGLVNDMFRYVPRVVARISFMVIVGSAVAAAAASRRHCRKGGPGRHLSGWSTGYWVHVEVIVTHFHQ
ncbi:hypothetical protein CORC01_06806, partial [Colletotrichum orchidophilum]